MSVPALADLEPRRLWHYFQELSRIPRGSKNEAAAARWAAEQGRALGLEVDTDAAGNVLIRKPATKGREARPGIALQAHLDMVCEKDAATAHDFTKDPIDAYFDPDGDVVRARGTTLGADNGIGVAAALAVLAEGAAHPALEVLLTVDEETGLTGANAVRAGWLRSPRLLNLDSEEEGELSIGCAGGQDSQATRPITWAAPAPGRRPLRLAVAGLKGGHSGVDIAAGRGNAIRILAQVLADAVPAHELQLGPVRGGTKRNAIPREAWAIVHVEPAREAALASDVARLAETFRAALGRFDPGLAISLAPPEADDAVARVLAPADAAALVGLLVAAPHGVEAMSPDIPGLVQTSTNLATVVTTDAAAEVGFLTRSALDDSKALLTARIARVAAVAGFAAKSGSGYPGWRPEPGAGLVQLVTGTYEKLFGKPMAVKAMHAGLECGIFRGTYPSMEMVSLGPSMWDVHTPNERVSIPSVQNFWRHLGAILADA